MKKASADLEVYKQMYHKNNPKSTKSEETQAVIAKVEEYVNTVLPTTVNSKSYDTNQRALLLLEAAKLYNSLDDYLGITEKFLTQSVRMNPKSAPAWHELGKCVMKRQDLEFAQSCFKIALGLNRNAETLTSMAVAIRLSALGAPERAQFEMRTKAMDLLIEARRLDSSHGPANCAFATGLFYSFFNNPTVDLSFLDKVVENYRKATECELTKSDPQVFINMATCLKFMEKYDEALLSYQKAVEYDSRNEFETLEKLNSCEKYLQKFSEAILKKGKIKAKRMAEMVNELAKLAETSQFRVKIIGNVSHEETIPVALVGVTSSGEVYGITIYNCLPDFGFVIGDTVTVSNPDFRKLENLTVLGTRIDVIRWVRVASPTQIKKNGVALPESVLAKAVAATQTK